MVRPANTIRATAIGASAIILWSSLALLTTLAKGLPPFEILGLSFTAAFIFSTGFLLITGRAPLTAWKQSLSVWALGVGGLFGYHFCYFLALGTAPAAEANLINYLWPLLIVLFSSFLPGERLRWFHVAGAALGLTGATLLMIKPGQMGFEPRFMIGYGAAVAAAVIWAGYSVLNRRFAHVPTTSVSGFCGLVALLAFLCHLSFEQTIIPNTSQTLATIAMGAGPVGAAFFLWDHGTKHGRIQVLGTLAYFTPLISTLLLIAAGKAIISQQLSLGCALIIIGALVAGHELFAKRKL